MEMYTASIVTEMNSVDRLFLLEELLMVSGISRTPFTVSLLRAGVLLSRTTHFPVIGQKHTEGGVGPETEDGDRDRDRTEPHWYLNGHKTRQHGDAEEPTSHNKQDCGESGLHLWPVEAMTIWSPVLQVTAFISVREEEPLAAVWAR
ncbi:hypothetical protein INR49_009283 [Caranx melampygus]|nr:hypothetical protein INR49_009283 [Caranx melampygus]